MILVTGGLGYVGAHIVWALHAAGFPVVVLDNRSNPHPNPLPSGVPLVVGDVGDRAVVRTLLRTHAPTELVHCAGLIQVGESVQQPERYWEHNFVQAKSLLDAFREAGASPRVVFSSTAAVYGVPERVPMDERHPRVPQNPYGESKLAVEQLLSAYDRAYGLRSVALRYFNAAGRGQVPGVCERHEPETHLLPLAIDAALGRRDALTVFGDDWDTPDGTCLRDYVHVEDLARAHLAALRYLREEGASTQLNLGTGHGASVREVLAAVSRVVGRPVPVRSAPRRAGDVAALVASAEQAAKALGWRAQHTSLDRIVRDALEGRVQHWAEHDANTSRSALRAANSTH